MDSPFFFEGTTYFSDGDETAHFEWLGRIACISEVWGRGSRLFLKVDIAAVTLTDTREMEAIYRRYGGDLGQLTSLLAFEGLTR